MEWYPTQEDEVVYWTGKTRTDLTAGLSHPLWGKPVLAWTGPSVQNGWQGVEEGMHKTAGRSLESRAQNDAES